MWSEVAIEKLERVDRNVLSCCRGGLRRWLDWVKEVKCSSFGTIGGLAFLHQDGTRALAEQQERKGSSLPPLPNHTCHHRVAS